MGTAQVSFRTNKGRMTAEVAGRNKRTVWVKLASGRMIKRHLAKHEVKDE